MILSTLLLLTAVALGLNIDDPRIATEAVQTGVQYHFLTAMGSLVFAALVHSIVLTYFVGTGRWLEETSTVYKLGDETRLENQSLKFRALAGIGFCFVFLVLVGASGAALDPASKVKFDEWGGIPGHSIHFMLVATNLGLHLVICMSHYQAIARNSQLIEHVLQQVQQIREKHGLST